MTRFFAALMGIDFATAGLKTYLGLLLAVAGLVAFDRGYISAFEAELCIGGGLILAGVGRFLAERRPEPPQGPPPTPPAVGTGALLLIALGASLCVVGCVPVEAVRHAEAQAVTAYGLSQRAPSEDGRTIGAMQLEAWRRQHISLSGDDVTPPDGATFPELRPLAEGDDQ